MRALVLRALTALLLLTNAWSLAGDNNNTSIRLCVRQDKLEDCQQLKNDADRAHIALACVSARDRLDCMHKVKKGEANLVNLPSDEAYTAHVNFELVPLQEEKTTEGDFMYEAVAVVRRTTHIHSLADLKKKRSCHTGYGRTAGWAIPIALLSAKKAFSTDTCGDEFATVSQFFDQSCVPGLWSRDPGENKRLKLRYPNLCALCSNKCSYDGNDDYLGYQGALKCVQEQTADVAFTKHSEVMIAARANQTFADQFHLLCPDGNLAPLNSTTCFWAARPNPLLVVHQSMSEDVKAVITSNVRQLVSVSVPRLSYFEETILSKNNSQGFVNVNGSIKDYLDKANFSITMDKPSGCRENYARLCMISDPAQAKCNDLRAAAFASRLRPRIECVKKASEEECLKSVHDKDTNLTFIGAGSLYRSSVHYSLLPMMSEVYAAPRDYSYYAVAVIKKNSSIKTFADLKGAKACHSHYMCSGGWRVPSGLLAKKKLISGKGCDLTKQMASFFSGMCAAGAPDSNSNLCSICKGDAKGENKCSKQDEYFGHRGAFRCLAEGAGDVAFIHHSTVLEMTDDSNLKWEWARSLKSSDFRLLCPSDEVKTVTEFASCNLAKLPGKQVVVSSDRFSDEENGLNLMLIQASYRFGSNSSIFRMFSEYNGMSSVVFTSGTTNLRPNSDNSTARSILGEDVYTLLELSDCTSSRGHLVSISILPILLTIILAIFR